MTSSKSESGRVPLEAAPPIVRHYRGQKLAVVRSSEGWQGSVVGLGVYTMLRDTSGAALAEAKLLVDAVLEGTLPFR